MKLDSDYLRRHYAELSDEALFAVDRGELVDAAKGWYDEEIGRRRAWAARCRRAAARGTGKQH